MPNPNKLSAIIDRTNPAVAMPEGLVFLAEVPKTIPIIDVIGVIIAPKNVSSEIIDIIPKTKDAIALLLDGLAGAVSILCPPPCMLNFYPQE